MELRLVLFDLDNTLIAGDSDYEWADFLIERGILERAAYEAKNRAFLADYRAGRLDIEAFLAFQLAPLGAYPRADLESWRTEFMVERIQPLISDAARRLVSEGARHADMVAIVTATNRFVTGPIARELGVEALLATEVEEIDGRFTGRHSGVPCFREGKLVHVDGWLARHGLDWTAVGESWFYSDSQNDMPLLSRVDHAIAVDPDPVLEAHAGAHGWPILRLNGRGEAAAGGARRP